MTFDSAENLWAFPNELLYVLSCLSLAEGMGGFTTHCLILEPGKQSSFFIKQYVYVVMDPARGQGEVQIAMLTLLCMSKGGEDSR